MKSESYLAPLTKINSRWIKDLKITSRDTIISVFASTALALGLVILSYNGNFSKFSSYLIGDILSIVPSEIYMLLAIAALVLVFWFLFVNKLLASRRNSSLARSNGINVRVIEDIFIILVAVIVMISIRWVGILIINSLLILPAASSRNISKNIRQYTIWAIIFAVFSGISGLVVSFYALTATGPTIVLISSIIFFVTYLLRKRAED